MDKIQIIDTQENFVVAHKPPGISFHQEDNQPGLFQIVQQQLNLKELYPVHRLDKVTSGIVIFATNSETASAFGELFENKRIEKYYLALSTGKPSKKQGLIKGDMVKARRGAWKLLRTSENPAITQFKSFGTQTGARIFLIKPHTGKTHQIRVALKSIGSPILGDALYSGDTENIDRAYLHAFALRFNLFDMAYEYCSPPQWGERFKTSEIETIIHNALTPPWNTAFPTLK